MPTPQRSAKKRKKLTKAQVRKANYPFGKPRGRPKKRTRAESAHRKKLVAVYAAAHGAAAAMEKFLCSRSYVTDALRKHGLVAKGIGHPHSNMFEALAALLNARPGETLEALIERTGLPKWKLLSVLERAERAGIHTGWGELLPAPHQNCDGRNSLEQNNERKTETEDQQKER